MGQNYNRSKLKEQTTHTQLKLLQTTRQRNVFIFRGTSLPLFNKRKKAKICLITEEKRLNDDVGKKD